MSLGTLESSGLVVDLEWAPPHQGGELLAVGWAGDEEDAHSAAPAHVPKALWDELADGALIVEFTKADAIELLRRGYDVTGPIVDLQVAAWVLNENQRLDLDHLSRKYSGIEMDKRLVRIGHRVLFRCDDGELVPIEDAPRRQLYAYNRRDVDAEACLLWDLIDKLQERGFLEYFLEEEVPYTRVLVEMQLAGIPIDLKAAVKLRDEIAAEHARLEAELKAGLPEVFNLGSDKQVGDYIFRKKVRIPGRIPIPADFDTLGMEVPDGFYPDWAEGIGRLWVKGEWVFRGLGLKPGERTPSGKPAVNKTALRMNPATQQHPWVVKYLDYQKVDTILTVFLRKFPEIARPDENGHPRIYCEFNQTGTRTGRLSSSNPNMQNVPVRGEMGKAVRGLFRAVDRSHPFLMGDFSQLETRLMAHFSQDPTLLEIFREERDPFIELATRIYGKPITKEDDERAVTKNVWYAQGYGATEYKISEMLTMEGFPTDEDTARDLLQELADVLPVYFEWREGVIEFAHNKGYVETIGGRRRRIQFSKSTTWKETSHGERAAGNAKVQGSAADVVRRTMLRFRMPALRLLLQVHDELIYEYFSRVHPEQRKHDARILKRVAERGHGYDITVPLVFDAKIAQSWAEKG